mgnify:CR=1 FL=1
MLEKHLIRFATLEDVDAIMTFINEILEINKIDSTKVEVENISFNLKELLFNIQSSLNNTN